MQAVSSSSLVASPMGLRQQFGGFGAERQGRRLASSLSLRSSSRRAQVVAQTVVDVSKVKPQGNRVLVKLFEPGQKTAGGVLLPSSAAKMEKMLIGEVIASGQEAQDFKPGQKLIFSDINAWEVDFGTKEKLCMVKAEDLVARVEMSS